MRFCPRASGAGMAWSLDAQGSRLGMLLHIGHGLKQHELQLCHGPGIKPLECRQIIHIPLQVHTHGPESRAQAVAQIGQQRRDITVGQIHGIDGDLELVQRVTQGSWLHFRAVDAPLLLHSRLHLA